MANVIIGNTLATPIAIPTKVSQLENDAEYITGGQVSEMDYSLYNFIMGDVGSLLEDKVDKPTITSMFFSTFPFEFASMYNSEMRLSSVTGEASASLSFIFGNGEYAPDYISGLSFDSGATPTAIDYTDSGIINWVGTDCSMTDDGLSIFQPSPNTHYDIVFYFNGTQFIGLVNGFVSSIEWQGALPTGNEAV